MSSLSITSTVTLTGIGPLELINKLGPTERNSWAARSVQNLVKRHLVDFNRGHGNKLEGKRTNFYSQLAESMRWEASDEGATVSITDFRARQTILGGLIKPGKNASAVSGKPTAALTIPASADSYNTRAKDWLGKSVAIYFKAPHGKLLGMIVDRNLQRLGAGKVRRNGAIMGGKLNEKGVFKFKRVLFWLVSEANQKGTPDAIPTEGEITQGAVDGVRDLVQHVFKGSGGVGIVRGGAS